MKRIGLFSGTFDPIHIGHLEVCLVARGACELDEVLVMLEKSPTRKENFTDYKDRKAMLELALHDFESINFFDHKADNITFENTMPELHQKYEHATFCLIVGSDALKYLVDWPGATEWLAKLELCVVLRDNKEKSAVQKQLKKLGAKDTKILPAVWSPISSSIVKKEIAKSGHSDLVHREVLEYIKKHRLYHQ